jgi:hypothetical protein
VLLVIGAYIFTVVAAIFIVVISTTFLINASNCCALGPSLVALWRTTAEVFIASGIVVKIVAWKITTDTAGRLVTVVIYGVVMPVTYAILAFRILLAFNC